MLSRFHNLNIRHLVKIFENNVRCIPDAAVMAATDKVEAVLVHGEAGDAVKVGHHAVHHLARVVVIEADVSVLVTGDGQGQRGV